MKNLIFKEFKLSVHPLTYLMLGLIALASLSGIGSFYPLCMFGVLYTFPFMGIKKGVTNNDLYYSLLLPVRREDVVKARIASTTVLQMIYTVLVVGLSGVALLIPNEIPLPQLSLFQPFAIISVCLITYTIFDFIYIPWFYHNGKEVVWNMLVGVIVSAIVSAALCVVPAFMPQFYGMLTIGSENANYFLQIGIFVASLAIYIGCKYAILKISTKNLLKLDF